MISYEIYQNNGAIRSGPIYSGRSVSFYNNDIGVYANHNLTWSEYPDYYWNPYAIGRQEIPYIQEIPYVNTYQDWIGAEPSKEYVTITMPYAPPNTVEIPEPSADRTSADLAEQMAELMNQWQEVLKNQPQTIGETVVTNITEITRITEIHPTPQPDPPITPPITGGTFSLDFSPLLVDFKGVFPFCIPFDLVNLITIFSATPEDFIFNVKVDGGNYWQIDHTVDLSAFRLPILFFRYVVIATFCWILMSRTRDLMKW